MDKIEKIKNKIQIPESFESEECKTIREEIKRLDAEKNQTIIDAIVIAARIFVEARFLYWHPRKEEWACMFRTAFFKEVVEGIKTPKGVADKIYDYLKHSLTGMPDFWMYEPILEEFKSYMNDTVKNYCD